MTFDFIRLFLSSVYLGSYFCLNMGNLNILKEIKKRKKEASLTKGPVPYTDSTVRIPSDLMVVDWSVLCSRYGQ